MAKTSERGVSPLLAEFPQTFKDTQALYMAIGHGISEWSKVEERLIRIAAKLLKTNVSKAGLVMYSIINFYVWLAIIDDLFDLDGTFFKAFDQWRQVLSDLKKENDVRVRLAHNTIHIDVLPLLKRSGPITTTLKPSRLDRRSKTTKHAPLTAKEIWDFADRLKNLCKQLDEVLKTMHKRKALR